jgi:histidine ammonia-lyase
MQGVLLVTGKDLTIDDVWQVSQKKMSVSLSDETRGRIKASRQVIEDIVASNDQAVYGVNTGFGPLKDERIEESQIDLLQKNLVRSHACGVGNPFAPEVVRAIMLLRAHALAAGYSGVRPQVVELLLNLINADVVPWVPAKGSVGASGDLAPLAHVALTLIGEGWVIRDYKMVGSKDGLAQKGLKPLKLKAKEGLALLNGTQAMTAIAALVIYRAKNLLKVADVATSLSLEALLGSQRAFLPEIQDLRPHPGQRATGDNILALTKDSPLMASHRDCSRVQDNYSLRCVPQVHGASKDGFRFAEQVIQIEINSVTDNPLVFAESGEVISGGNFHGQPVGHAMDHLRAVMAEIGNISERRVERLMDSHLSELPMFLSENPGINSGLMIAQYTAASLVSENKGLSFPSTVDSIPTSANQEDHVSMGTIAARRTEEVLNNLEYILAIELICACQALEFRKPKTPGVGALAAYHFVRNHIPRLKADRILHGDIELARRLIAREELVNAVEKAIGELRV